MRYKDIADYTALHYASVFKQVGVINVILETPEIDKQKLLEMQDKEGYTALHFASNVRVIQEILETPGIDKQKLLEIQNKAGETALQLAVSSYSIDKVKILLEHQISTVGLRDEEKKAMNFIKPEELKEILKIEFSDELGVAGSTVRLEREALVLKGIHDHLKNYGTDISWTSSNAWAASFSRMNERVNVLAGEMQNIVGVGGGVIVQKEIDRVMKKIMPKPQNQSANINHVRAANPVHQNRGGQRR